MGDLFGLLIIILFVFALVKFPFLRYTLKHPIKVFKTAVYDARMYFKHKKYNECKEFGKIRMYCAKGTQVFGCGKTLTAVKDALDIYNKYDGLPVWDDEKQEFVTQHVHIVSNVELKTIPYYRWVGEKQFTEFEKFGFEQQDITIFILDEAGAEFNSRNFKNNISMEFLTKLLQSRKNKMSLFLTSQRFGFTDKILRETCDVVYACRKIWRFVMLFEYDAYEAERCDNYTMLNPLSVQVWFATNKDYNAYDTSQLVERFKQIEMEGGFLTTEEILATRGEDLANIDMVQNKLKKRYRRKTK